MSSPSDLFSQLAWPAQPQQPAAVPPAQSPPVLTGIGAPWEQQPAQVPAQQPVAPPVLTGVGAPWEQQAQAPTSDRFVDFGGQIAEVLSGGVVGQGQDGEFFIPARELEQMAEQGTLPEIGALPVEGPVSDLQGPIATELTGRGVPLTSRFGAAFDRGIRDGNLGATVGRNIADNLSALAASRPGGPNYYSEPAYDEQGNPAGFSRPSFDEIRNFQRERRRQGRLEEAYVPPAENFAQGATDFLGEMGGTVASGSPENFVGISMAGRFGNSAVRRVLAAAGIEAGINAGVDPVIQQLNIDAGAQDEFSAMQILMSAALGAGIGGIGRTGVEGFNGLTGALQRNAQNAGVDLGQGSFGPDNQISVEQTLSLLQNPEVRATMQELGILDPTNPQHIQILSAVSEAAPHAQNLSEAARVAQASNRLTPEGIDAADRRISRRLEQREGIPLGDRAPRPDRSQPEYANVSNSQLRRAQAEYDRMQNQGVETGAGISRMQREVADGERDPSTLPTAGRQAEALPEVILASDGRVNVDAASRASDRRVAAPNATARDPGINEGARAANQAADAADAQSRAGFAGARAQQELLSDIPDTFDTQPAGRPQGVSDTRPITIHQDYPVLRTGRRRTATGSNGKRRVEYEVQRYDPRTEQPLEGSVPYFAPRSEITQANFTPEPRSAQDFVGRVEDFQTAPNGQRMLTPELERTADERKPGVRSTLSQFGKPQPVNVRGREPGRTFSATSREDNVSFRDDGTNPDTGGGGPTQGRSPIPEQTRNREGEQPFKERADAEEAEIRRLEEEAERVRQQERQRRERGERAQSEGNQQQYQGRKSTSEPRWREDGDLEIDENGFVISEGGGPVAFKSTRDLARAVREWQKKTGRSFEPAIHPTATRSTGMGGTEALLSVKSKEGQNRSTGEGERASGTEAPEGEARNQDSGEPDTGSQAALEGPRRQSSSDTRDGGDTSPADDPPNRQSADRADDDTPTAASRDGDADTNTPSGKPDIKDFEGDGPGTKLYANPLDPTEIIKTLRYFYGASASGARATAALIKRTSSQVGKEGNLLDVIKNSAQYAGFSSHQRLTAIASRNKSPTVRLIADLLGREPGSTDRTIKKTMSEAIDQRHTEMTNAFQKIAVDYLGESTVRRHGPTARNAERSQEAFYSQLSALLRNPQSIKPNTRIGQAALAVKKLLEDELKYLRDAGVEVGEVKNGFLPRVLDVSMIIQRGSDFTDAAAKVLRRHGLSPIEAREAAESWRRHALGYGEVLGNMDFNGANTRPNFLKGRSLEDWVDVKGKSELAEFYVTDTRDLLGAYFSRSARVAEWTRRFGKGGERWVDEFEPKMRDEGLSPEEIRLVRRSLLEVAGVGIRATFDSPGVRAGASIARTANTLGLLERSTLTSLPEMIAPAVRSGNVLDAFSSGARTIAAWSGRIKSQQDLADWMEDQGLIMNVIDGAYMSARWADLDPDAKKAAVVLDRYFKTVGLESFTRSTRVAAAGMGQVVIRRWLKQASRGSGSRVARENLAELGIDRDQVDDMISFLDQYGESPTRAEIKQAGEVGQQYVDAVHAFMDQSIMRPNRATRPSWAQGPEGSLVFQLQSFLWAFGRNLVYRPLRSGQRAIFKGWSGADRYSALDRARMLGPMAGLSAYVAYASSLSMLRDELLLPQARKDDMEPEEWFMRGVSRSGIAAQLDPLINTFTGVRYNRSVAESLLGPAVGRPLAAIEDYLRFSGARNSENTNQAERAATQATYDIILEPALNYALTFAPAGGWISGGLTFAARQGIGAPETREQFIEMIAGPRAGSGSSSNQSRRSRRERPNRSRRRRRD